jgi:hypothetical protein
MPKRFTDAEAQLLKALSANRAPIRDVVRITGRTAAALRQRASKLGISLGHQKRQRSRRAG